MPRHFDMPSNIITTIMMQGAQRDFYSTTIFYFDFMANGNVGPNVTFKIISITIYYYYYYSLVGSPFPGNILRLSRSISIPYPEKKS